MPSQKKAEYLPQEAEAVASDTPAGSTSTPAPGAVHFEGPEPDQDSQGEEIPVWSVYAATDDGDLRSKVYHCSTYSAGWGLAQRMAKDRKLQLINEADQA